MANKEHLEMLKQGVQVWNEWREENPEISPDLRNGQCSYMNLRGADLSRADFRGTDLFRTNLLGADLLEVNLSGVNLTRADLSYADLRCASIREANLTGVNLGNANCSATDLSYANLRGSDIHSANLGNANLNRADLMDANLNFATLQNTNLEKAIIGNTLFVDVDLSTVMGLETIDHRAPSQISIDTLYKSAGLIPKDFLRGCGVPEDFIAFIPSIIGAREAIQFYSCFISFSTRDEDFARRLHSRMRDEKLRVWFAPEDMKGGKLLHEQIEQAIQLHDRLLVVLSEESMASEWVKREIRNARRAEVREKRRKLFPIRLVDYKGIEEWKGFDGDGGEDLAFELGKYYIPDFSNWKDHDVFEREFEKLLRDLRAEEK